VRYAVGVVALALTIVGVDGVIAYSAQQRRQEFGMRSLLFDGSPFDPIT
jgi:hypothetical protein